MQSQDRRRTRRELFSGDFSFVIVAESGLVLLILILPLLVLVGTARVSV